MSGHSKWANIKHRKGAQDAKRSKLFQKLATEIMVAIKVGGNDPSTNTRLRLAIEKAKGQNMPNSNIGKLLKTKPKSGADFKELTYEGYGPFGTAILVQCLTDNLKRTSATVTAAFTKNGGNLGTNGSVSYLFSRKGLIVIDEEIIEEDKLMEIALSLDILDVKIEPGFYIIETEPGKFLKTKEELENAGIMNFISTEVSMVPKQTIELSEKEQSRVEKLVELLEDNNDVQAVYTNIT
ncbi:MAG: YebC/PmpR family DNA-binding transcriptional regulator [Mycoplasmataceae bacterium]|nr:YebC/PmpR family DNA-binding transcriptional regulator [Mycoplasmataceae bacterium]